MKTLFLGAVLAAACAPSVHALNLVKNGGFEVTTGGTGQIGYNTVAAFWSLSKLPGDSFIFASGAADTTGAFSKTGHTVKLWGPRDHANNGLPAASPNGGNFLASNGLVDRSAIVQTIHGLVAGKSYDLTFDYGFAEGTGAYQPSIQDWRVSLGGQSRSTSSYDLPARGFSGWLQANMVFTASGATETLSFLAQSDSHVPPFALLDGVNLSPMSLPTPEPATWALMLAGFGGLGAAIRRRRSQAAI